MKKYMVVERPDDVSKSFGKKVRNELNANGYLEDEEQPEIVFVIGGDGTFIYAVHEVLRKHGTRMNDIAFYGIHTGTLGFYTDFRDSDYREFMDAFFAGNYRVVNYPLLSAFIDHKVQHNAINEVRIENAARTQYLEIYINDVLFETFRGTGICVSTQLGSTAFNRSLGGAVIQEGLPLIEMTEIAGIHHIKYRSLEAPLILTDDTVIKMKSKSFDGALLGIDSDVYPLDGREEVIIARCESTSVRMLRGREVSWFDKVKSLF